MNGLRRRACRRLRVLSHLNGDGDAPSLSGASRAAGARLGMVFASLRKRQDELSLLDLFDRMLEESGYGGSFRPDIEEDMDRMANVLELRSDISRYNEMAASASLPAYLEQVALVADVDSLDRNRTEAVTMITLHSAKGLEYPVVFIAGVEEGLLPISRAIEAEYDDPNQVEEERRLFYVGITRAKRLLYLTYTGMRMSYGRTDSQRPVPIPGFAACRAHSRGGGTAPRRRAQSARALSTVPALQIGRTSRHPIRCRWSRN